MKISDGIIGAIYLSVMVYLILAIFVFIANGGILYFTPEQDTMNIIPREIATRIILVVAIIGFIFGASDR